MFSKHHPSVWPHDHHLQIDQLALSFLLSPRDLSILIFLLQIEPPNSSLSSLVLLLPTLQVPSVTLSATLWLLPTETSETILQCLQHGMTGEMDGIKRCLANVTYFKTLPALSFINTNSGWFDMYDITLLILQTWCTWNILDVSGASIQSGILAHQVWQRRPSWNWKTPCKDLTTLSARLFTWSLIPINRGH